MHRIVLLAVVLVAAACGESKPRGTLAERACASHMKVRAKEQRPAGAAESGKCVAAMNAMEKRTTPSGFTCAVNCMQLRPTLAQSEQCVYLCEEDALPRVGNGPDPAGVQIVANAWINGIVGDNPR